LLLLLGNEPAVARRRKVVIDVNVVVPSFWTYPRCEMSSLADLLLVMIAIKFFYCEKYSGMLVVERNVVTDYVIKINKRSRE
jgi:hypothetical protein